MYVREYDGEAIRLGVSGRLWRDALVMYDRTTGSFWSQVDGRAIAGSAEGNRLVELPATVTSWGDWKRRHPETLVLKSKKWAMKSSRYAEYFSRPGQLGILGTNNADPRMTGKYLVYGFSRGGRSGAIKIQTLIDHGWAETDLGEIPVLIVSMGDQDGAAYSRRLGSRTLTFVRSANGTLKDRETETIWDPETGVATEGPLRGKALTRVAGRRVYWFIWVAFHPETAILTPG